MPKPLNKGPKNPVVAIEGTEGNDVITLVLEDNTPSVATTNGDDTVFGYGGIDWIEGGDGNDTIDGGADGDWIWGGLGDDVILGGLGDDFLFGEEGLDTIDGGAGADVIDGGAGNDTINGGDDNDIIIGGSGDDTLLGGLGDDTFIGGAGNDSIDGGDGTDTVTYIGLLGVDYTIETVTEVEGKGRARQDVEVTYVTAADGTVDRFVNVEFFVFSDTTNTDAPSEVIYTLDDSDILFTTVSSSATIDVLANDFFLASYSEDPIYGSGLEIVDIQDVDGGTLIDGDPTLSEFLVGVTLTDESVLKLNEDGTVTFTASNDLTQDTSFSFQYTVAHGEDLETGTVTFNVIYSDPPPPPPGESLELETVAVEPAAGGPYYIDGSYAVTQVTGFFGLPEYRDGSSQPDYDYDYDDDGDAEWKVWTDDSGTKHDMNVTTVNNAEDLLDLDLSTAPSEEFIFESFKLTGFGPGEKLTVEYYTAAGGYLGEEIIDSVDDLSSDGETFISSYDGLVGQISISADPGTEVFIDDIVLV